LTRQLLESTLQWHSNAWVQNVNVRRISLNLYSQLWIGFSKRRQLLRALLCCIL